MSLSPPLLHRLPLSLERHPSSQLCLQLIIKHRFDVPEKLVTTCDQVEYWSNKASKCCETSLDASSDRRHDSWVAGPNPTVCAWRSTALSTCAENKNRRTSRSDDEDDQPDVEFALSGSILNQWTETQLSVTPEVKALPAKHWSFADLVCPRDRHNEHL